MDHCLLVDFFEARSYQGHYGMALLWSLFAFDAV